MILTALELHLYRACVGLQVQYAQAGDSHKVMDLQIQLEDWIKRRAEAKIKAYAGKDIVAELNWSEEARAQYRKLCADAMRRADEGFASWAAAQQKVEQWVSDFIQQGVFQATIKIKN